MSVQNQSNYSDQLQNSQLTNQNTKQIHVVGVKRGKTRASKSRLAITKRGNAKPKQLRNYFRHSIENRSIKDLSTFVSDGMTTNDLYFKWNDGGTGDLNSAVAMTDELIMSQFAVDDYAVQEITASYVTGTALGKSFIFSIHT